MTNTALAHIGRILFGLPFIFFGIFHLMQPGGMAQSILQGWPIASALVVISGIGMILAGIAIVINKLIKLATVLLALELLVFVLAIHLPGLAGDGGQQVMINLLKDISLMGGALMAGAYFDGGEGQASNG